MQCFENFRGANAPNAPPLVARLRPSLYPRITMLQDNVMQLSRVVVRDNEVVVDGVPLYIQNTPPVLCEHLWIWFRVSSKKWRLEISAFRSYCDGHM